MALLTLGLLATIITTLTLGPTGGDSFIACPGTVAVSVGVRFRGSHTTNLPVEPIAPRMVLNITSNGNIAAFNDGAQTMRSQVGQPLTIGSNTVTTTVSNISPPLLQLTRRVMVNRFRALVTSKVINVAVPIIAPKFRDAFESLPDSWVLEFAKTTMRDLNVQDLQEILEDQNLRIWFMQQDWWLQAHLNAAVLAFDKLPDTYVIILTRTMMARMSDEDAGKMLRDIPKNVMKNILRKHGQEKALENLLFRMPMLSFALRIVKDESLHRTQGAAFAAIVNIVKVFRP